jgi:hypothetical protein
MERQVQDKVIELTRRHSDKLTQDTGVIPSLQENEIQAYTHEVLVELGRIGKKEVDECDNNLEKNS